MSFADKVTKIMFFIVKIKLSGLLSELSLPPSNKTQCFVYLSFDSNLQLITDISSDLQKLFRYLNGAAILASSRIMFAWFGLGCSALSPNNLDLYWKI